VLVSWQKNNIIAKPPRQRRWQGRHKWEGGHAAMKKQRLELKLYLKYNCGRFFIEDLMLRKAQLQEIRSKLSPNWTGSLCVREVVEECAYVFQGREMLINSAFVLVKCLNFVSGDTISSYSLFLPCPVVFSNKYLTRWPL